MTSNELRIGNMVYKSLKSGQGRTVINPIGCQDIVRIFEDIGSFNYAPIPLTEDILLKCGATSVIFTRNNEISSFDIGDLMFEKEENGYCVFGSEWTIGKPFHHLHQLQNLYFALTQKELTIKL